MDAEDEVAGRRRPSRTVWTGLVVAAAAAVVAVLIWSGRSEERRPNREGTATTQPVEPTSSPEVGPIQALSGPGDKTSDAFTVTANWEIRWKSTPGKPFAIELLGKDGTSRGEVVKAGDRSEGVTFVSEAGEFKLEVTATGDWSIQVFGRPPHE